MNLATKIKTAFAFLCMTAVFGCAGGDCTGDSSSPSELHISFSLTSIEPCVISPGQVVRVYGTYTLPPQIYTFSPSITTTGVTQQSNYADMTVPAGAVTGSLIATRTAPNGISSVPYTIGTLVSVPEIEPNEAIDGSNATPVGNNRTATGNLANAGDADHFRFGCVLNKPLRVTLNPPLVGNVFVNGTAVTLTAGSGTLYCYNK